jgi:hypothetical protein
MRKQRLLRAVDKLIKLLKYEPVDSLNDEFVKVYEIYGKLSARDKESVEKHLNHLKERFEDSLNSEKQFEASLESSQYDELFAHYQKLPSKSQGKVYPYLVNLRQKLEGN